jgi:AcrR family transcriptional regulator
VPTGVAIRDPREQLFDAAERILLRDGPNALTSRAVTTEAGFAKGVMHRHFADFDAFLAELVEDRIARLERQAAALRDSAGTGTVAGNLTAALTDLFGSVAVAIVALIISRDNLRARLRQATPATPATPAPARQATPATPTTPARLRQARPSGVPLLTEATAMIASYLTIERDLGRIIADAEVDALAPMLIGTGHLLFAGRDGTPPEPGAVAKVVTAAIASVMP